MASTLRCDFCGDQIFLKPQRVKSENVQREPRAFALPPGRVHVRDGSLDFDLCSDCWNQAIKDAEQRRNTYVIEDGPADQVTE